MLKNTYYSQEQHGPYELFELGDFELESGAHLPDCQLAYATHGTLNEARDNAILFPIMYSGTSKNMEHYVGAGLALDPEKYFIILPNQIGNGLSTSPHNSPAPYGMSRFPAVSIGDDVRAQHRLVTEKFGIETLQLVLGWSMGAQQTYEWAVRFPDMVRRAAPIAGTAKTTPHDSHYIDVFCEALTSDPAWNSGEYSEPNAVEAGLCRQARIFALMGASQQFYKEECWRRLEIDTMEDFMSGFWEAWFKPMDPNNLLCMARKWQKGDVSQHTQGDLRAALERIQARVFVIAFERDMFIPVEDCRAEQAMISNSELRIIPTLWGHFGMLGLFPEDFGLINETLQQLLAN